MFLNETYPWQRSFSLYDIPVWNGCVWFNFFSTLKPTVWNPILCVHRAWDSKKKKSLLSLKVEGTFEKGNMLHSGNSEEKNENNTRPKRECAQRKLSGTRGLYFYRRTVTVCVCVGGMSWKNILLIHRASNNPPSISGSILAALGSAAGWIILRLFLHPLHAW